MQNAECTRILHSAFAILHFMSSDRPTHLGLRHLALNVRELDAMKRFYVDVLGFEVEWEPDPDNVYLSSGRDNLALHRRTGGSPGASPLGHLGRIVDTGDRGDPCAA